jgi:hypothetical protein
MKKNNWKTEKSYLGYHVYCNDKTTNSKNYLSIIFDNEEDAQTVADAMNMVGEEAGNEKQD